MTLHLNPEETAVAKSPPSAAAGEAPLPDEQASYATLADPALWQRAAEGDHAAFGALFERHSEAVWNHAYRLTASWSTAEDLTSSVFLTAWRRRGDMRLTRQSALPWLFTVAGNLARTEFRSSSRLRRALSRLGGDREPVTDHAERFDDQLAGEDRLRRVLAAVDRLPQAEREAVQLCLLGELSITDAAEALGVAEVSVRSRISRARSRLRTLFDLETR
ncbi:RNA polymerase sigma-70 factor (ECF subfamily) [Actinoalloteichus hoggarensis]|nr:RNA polymerase sigma-70 factor (ECF subfamily) [Actinoalloteichus hoggarensis]